MQRGHLLVFLILTRSSQKLGGANHGLAGLIYNAFISMVIPMWRLLPAPAQTQRHTASL